MPGLCLRRLAADRISCQTYQTDRVSADRAVCQTAVIRGPSNLKFSNRQYIDSLFPCHTTLLIWPALVKFYLIIFIVITPLKVIYLLPF